MEQSKIIKYFMYCRKSSEDSKERQMQSIESQQDDLTRLAESQGLCVVDIISEEQSAHTAGRPRFNEMLQRLQNGEANAILVWHPNRLARNMTDAGFLIALMDNGIVKEVKTMGKTYLGDSSDKFFMILELAISKKDSDDKSIVVKRGLEKKCRNGLMPGLAPAGYMNTPELAGGSRYIKKDLDKFDLIKKAWEMMASGNYSVRQLRKIMNEEWGFRTRTFKRQGGGPISVGSLYKIFNDHFYYGYFEYPRGSGHIYKGVHEPMILEEVFNRVQSLLDKKIKAKPKTKNFAYGAGMIKCGECSSQITIEDKYKKQKNGTVHHYIIYRCTKNKNHNCSQHGIQESVISEQTLALLEQIRIPAEFYDFALDFLRQKNKEEAGNRNAEWGINERAYKMCLAKLDGLIDMRAAKELSEEEYSSKKAELIKEKDRLEILLNGTGKRAENWLELAEDVFTFARDAKERFEKGDLQAKRQILSALGSNFILKDKKLTLDLENVLFPVQIVAKELKSGNESFAPLKNRMNKRQTGVSTPACRALLRGEDSNL